MERKFRQHKKPPLRGLRKNGGSAYSNNQLPANLGKRKTLVGLLGETVIGLLLAAGSPRHIDLLANQILARNQFIKSKLRDSLALCRGFIAHLLTWPA